MYPNNLKIIFLLMILAPGMMPAKSGIFESKEDTLIVLEGKVFDIFSKEPIKATILYEKLPYGNDMGLIHTNDSGTYEFFVFPSSQYKILVKARDYLAVVENVSPEECGVQSTLYRDFYLRPIKLGESITLQNLFFNQGDYTLQESCYEELDQLVLMLNEYQKMEIQLEGHTDCRGDRKLNHKLSLQRVTMVKDYLVAKGIKKDRIKVQAFGGDLPISRDNTEEARKQNRRVEIRILRI
jgi:OmpA-OmpF porin, OOP family